MRRLALLLLALLLASGPALADGSKRRSAGDRALDRFEQTIKPRPVVVIVIVR
jgi:hypothetical protein